MLTPNLIAKPATVMITKVTIKGMKQAVQMFGPAQYAVAKAVADCVAEGTIPAARADDLVIICGVFIHPEAEDDAKIRTVQLRGHQAVDPARHEERCRRLPRSRRRRIPSSTRSPVEVGQWPAPNRRS